MAREVETKYVYFRYPRCWLPLSIFGSISICVSEFRFHPSDVHNWLYSSENGAQSRNKGVIGRRFWILHPVLAHKIKILYYWRAKTTYRRCRKKCIEIYIVCFRSPFSNVASDFWFSFSLILRNQNFTLETSGKTRPRKWD